MHPLRNLPTSEQQSEIARLAGQYHVDSSSLRGALYAVADVLEEDEILCALLSGRLERPVIRGPINLGIGDMLPRLIALTNRRLVFIRKRVLRPVETSSIPLNSITNVTADVGIVQGSVFIRGPGKEQMIGGIPRKAVSLFANALKVAIAALQDHGSADAPWAAKDVSVRTADLTAGPTTHHNLAKRGDSESATDEPLSKPTADKSSRKTSVLSRSSTIIRQHGSPTGTSLRILKIPERREVLELLTQDIHLGIRKHRRTLDTLPDILEPEEILITLTSCTLDRKFRSDLLAVTDRRLIILAKTPGEELSFQLPDLTILSLKGQENNPYCEVTIREATDDIVLRLIPTNTFPRFVAAILTSNDQSLSSVDTHALSSSLNSSLLSDLRNLRSSDDPVAHESRKGSVDMAADAATSVERSSAMLDLAAVISDAFPTDDDWPWCPTSFVTELDAWFGTRLAQLAATLNAVFARLTPSESLRFAAEVSFKGSRNPAIVAVTDSMLFTVDRGGKRISQTELDDIVAIDAHLRDNSFTVVLHNNEKIELTTSDETPCLAYAIIAQARARGRSSNRGDLHVEPPEAFKRGDVLVPNHYYVRHYGWAGPDSRNVTTVADFTMDLTFALQDVMDTEESILSQGRFIDVDGKVIIGTVTTERLLFCRGPRVVQVRDMFPVLGPQYSVRTMALSDIVEAELQMLPDQDSCTVSILTEVSDEVAEYQLRVDDEVSLFVRDLRAAVKGASDHGGSPTVDLEPIWWPSLAFDRLCQVSSTDGMALIASSKSTYVANGRIRSYDIHRFGESVRMSLYHSLSVAYGLQGSHYQTMDDMVVRIVGSSECLVLLFMIQTDTVGSKDMVVLTDAAIYVVGDDVEDAIVSPLTAVSRIRGNAEEGVSEIEVMIGGYLYVFPGVPRRALQYFVEAVSALRGGSVIADIGPSRTERRGETRARRGLPLEVRYRVVS